MSKNLKTFLKPKSTYKTLILQTLSEDSKIGSISFTNYNGHDSEGKGNVDFREVNLRISFKCFRYNTN